MVKNKVEFKPKEKIIKYLIENKTPVSIRETSSATKIDYKNTYEYIKDLEKVEVIKFFSESIGVVNPIKLNIASNQEIFSVEEKRTKGFFNKHSNLRLIQKDVHNQSYPFMIVLIFGSYAKNEETKNSDIDLCIISDNKREIKKLIDRLSLLPLNIEIQEFSTREFISMIEKRQNTLGHEIVKNNIIIYNIEGYYNLISKWMKEE